MPLFISLVFKALKAIWQWGECEICCPYRLIKVTLQFITESDMLVIKSRDVRFPSLPLMRKSNVKRASDLVTLELQQKFLVFSAALQQKGLQVARTCCTREKLWVWGAEEGRLAICVCLETPS